MTKGKASKGAELICHKHNTIPAVTSCVKCDRKICAYCTESAKFPHMCPSCYSKEYNIIQEKHLRFKKRAKWWLIASVMIIVAMFILLPTLNWALDKAFKEEDKKDTEVPPVANAYLVDDDVYLFLGDHIYNNFTKKVTMSINIYLTNEYKTDATGIKIELLILKNTTIRQEQSLDVGMILSNKTQTYTYDNIQLFTGTYYANFIMWKGNMVYRQVRISFILNTTDVTVYNKLGEQALNTYNPYAPPVEVEEINKPQVIKDEIIDSFFEMLPFMILILFVEGLLVALIIYYKENSFDEISVYADSSNRAVAMAQAGYPAQQATDTDAEDADEDAEEEDETPIKEVFR